MTKRKNAFTLAEMLITLSVIGIVAALTIPGLVKNHNEKAWATAQDVFTKKLEVAMKAMNTDGTLTGYSTTANFVNALKKNIKITKVCTDDVTKCFSKEVIWNEGEDPVEVTNSAVTYDDSQGQDWAETVGVQFNNGITALMAYNKNCSPDLYNNQEAVTGQCVGIIYDVSANKNPNANGKDIASNANVASLGGNSGCVYKFNDDTGEVCISKILKPNVDYKAMSKTDCDAAVTAGTLGINACNYDDYWAGAVQACGGKSKMLTMKQLGYLATDLYNYTSTIGAYQDVSSSSGYTLDTEKAQSFLAQSPYSGEFYIWSSEELSSIYVYRRYFASRRTDYSSIRRTGINYLAVCIGD